MTHTNTEWSLGGLSGLDCVPDQRCLQIPQILPVAPILDRDRTTAVGKVRLALRNFGIFRDLPGGTEHRRRYDHWRSWPRCAGSHDPRPCTAI